MDPAQHACHLELGIETLAKQEDYEYTPFYASKLILINTVLHTIVVKKILEQEVQPGETRDHQRSCMSALVDQVEGDEHINTILDSSKVRMRVGLLKKFSGGGMLIRSIRDGNDILVSDQLNFVKPSDVDVAFKKAVELFR